MKKNLLAAVIMLSHSWLYGQDITRSLPQREADKLKHSLSATLTDAAKTDVLLRLALFNIFKPGIEKSDVDSAKNYIRQAEPIVARMKSLAYSGYLSYVNSNLSRETGDTKTGKTFSQSAVSQLKHSGDEYHLALAYVELAQYESIETSGNIHARIELTELAVTALERTKQVELRAFLLKNLAELYSMLMKDEIALKMLHRSLDDYQAIHYQQLQGVYTLFGVFNYSAGNFQKSLSYLFKALRTAENLKDTTMQLCQINNLIGMAYNRLDEPQNAIPYYVRSMETAQRNKEMNSVFYIMLNTVIDYIKLKEYQEALRLVDRIRNSRALPQRASNFVNMPISYLQIYLAKGDYKKAAPYCIQLKQMLKLYPSIEPSLVNNIYISFIHYHLHQGQLSQARKYLSANEKLIGKIKEPQMYKDQFWNAFKIDSAAGNFKGAMNNLLKFRRLNDSLFTEKKSEQIKQIEAQYQTEKKENQLKIKDQAIGLLQQKEQIQQKSLQNANLLRNFTFGGILLLLVILGQLYRQYLGKRKSNEIALRNNLIVTQKNELLEHLLKEKEWLLKEVHHRVKNNLHTVICLLESQALYLENDALKAIESSQHRIYAMSLIHQKLYQADDIKTIDMSVYLPEFIQYLNESFGTQRRVRFHLEIELVQLGVSQAIPLALIVNEAVTNSIKYAFTPDLIGVITISMNQREHKIALVIADNGIGLDPAIINMPSESLGLKLMNGLSEDINAHIAFENNKGTRITIVFDADPLNQVGAFMVPISKSIAT